MNADKFGYLGANGDFTSFNLYAYCSNNPVMYVDSCGNSCTEALNNWITSQQSLPSIDGPSPVLDLIYYLVMGILAVGALMEGSVLEQPNTISSQPETKQETESKPIAIPKTDTKNKNKILFPQDPNIFIPIGLKRVERSGTKNERIISWMDPITNLEVFRWDENLNFSNGSHYHINNPMYLGKHFYAGDEIPEPYASIYFPSLIN